MRKLITEADVEEYVLDILKNFNYDIIRGSNEEYLPGGKNVLEFLKSLDYNIIRESNAVYFPE